MSKRAKLVPIEEPEEHYRRELYKIYKSILDTSLNVKKKRNLLTYLFAWENWSWRVVGISVNALQKIKDNDFVSNQGIVRGHINDRSKTYDLLTSKTVEYEEWWKTFWDNDATELVTKEENGKKQTKSKIVEIDVSKGYFVSNGLVGFKFRKTAEGEYCRDIWKQKFKS